MRNNGVQDEFLRRRMERQKRLKKRRAIGFLIFTIILLLIVGVCLCFTVFFPIENIAVSGSKLYTADQILTVCDIEIGDNLFAISKSNIEQKLKKQLPFIEKVELSRDLPGDLKIKVSEANEYSAIKQNGSYYILSKENWVLSKEKKLPKGVFEIKIKDAKCKVGTAADLTNAKNVDILNELIEELEKNKIKIDYIDVTNKLTLEAGVDGRFVVNYGNPNSLPQKTKHLKEMVKSIEKGASGRINLNMWTSQNTQGTFVKDME